jgi:hypothetical protein
MGDLYSKVKEILKKDEINSAGAIFKNSVFIKILNRIKDVKRDAIVDEINTQEELDMVRMTLEGNKEILDVFQRLYTDSLEKEEEIDPYEIIDSQ